MILLIIDEVLRLWMMRLIVLVVGWPWGITCK